jgi:hypothetical protein
MTSGQSSTRVKPPTDSDLYVLLESRVFDRDPSQCLRQCSDYLAWAASAIDPMDLIVVDKNFHLDRFEDVFLLMLGILRDWTPSLYERAAEVEKASRLCDNVHRLATVCNAPLYRFGHRLGWLSKWASTESVFSVTVNLPDKGEVPITRNTLVQLRSAVQRVAGIAGAGAREVAGVLENAKETLIVEHVYDPRRIAKGLLLKHVTAAAAALQRMDLPPSVKATVDKQLRDTISDIERPSTPWNRVFSRLSQLAVIIGGLTAFGAEIDDCYENIRKALNVMTETSVVHEPPTNQPPMLIANPASQDSATAVSKQRE